MEFLVYSPSEFGIGNAIDSDFVGAFATENICPDNEIRVAENCYSELTKVDIRSFRRILRKRIPIFRET